MTATAAPPAARLALPFAGPPTSGRRLGLVVGACLVLAVVSLWAIPSTPTYDPWAWILWGREILHLNLDTTFGPSWKPLPILLTTPFALFGSAAPDLWLVVARAGGLLALAMAYRLARRLTGPGPGGHVAGVAALVGLLSVGYPNFSSFVGVSFAGNAALGNSEGLLIAFALLAFERHLDGRCDHALVLAGATALLRPEAWPFLACYALWCWHYAPHLRRLIVAFAVVIPLLWIVPEELGSGRALRAAERAQLVAPGAPAATSFPAKTVLERARPLLVRPLQAGLWIATLLALVQTVRRRDRALTALAALSWAWLVLVAVMTQFNASSGNPRYILLPLAVFCVLAGIAFGRLARGAAAGATALAGLVGARATARRVDPPLWRSGARSGRSRLAGSLALALVAVLALGSTAYTLYLRREKLNNIPRELSYQAALASDLPAAIRIGGGRGRLLHCGTLSANQFNVPMVAWTVGVHIEQVSSLATSPGTVLQSPPTRDEWTQPELPLGLNPLLALAGQVGDWTVLQNCHAPAAPRGP